MTPKAKSSRRLFLDRAGAGMALAALSGRWAAGQAPPAPRPGRPRVTLGKPGPMLPPVPAILLSVLGAAGEPDEISVVWTFVVNGDPPQVGISVGDEHRAGALVALHREFVLNVPTAALVHPFDVVDMNSGKLADKFALSGLTRARAAVVKAPTVNESPIHVECRVSHSLRVPPERTLFVADVVATTVHEGVCDGDGRLIAGSAAFFGMTAGSGEFHTLGQKVGHIGQSVGRDDIRY